MLQVLSPLPVSKVKALLIASIFTSTGGDDLWYKSPRGGVQEAVMLLGLIGSPTSLRYSGSLSGLEIAARPEDFIITSRWHHDAVSSFNSGHLDLENPIAITLPFLSSSIKIGPPTKRTLCDPTSCIQVKRDVGL
ncbi:hypothetical protein K435DRAFT_853416 [Dendrothele bispora CBS 962.96]|uniref:Uncharacterized protein n=1 Tax=Dendrothele bispora (strain CBS 962.96) TaxID=1314807 RepID=A0A4S8MAA8_DENBC|nr:hypothetical protein K435DRAFT_855788 [Dendrothele bispora CBS 962.96]THV01718.1 hypothetical protein K435DRAFT_853416 [Dendrothele bispora CBS 962.96]